MRTARPRLDWASRIPFASLPAPPALCVFPPRASSPSPSSSARPRRPSEWFAARPCAGAAIHPAAPVVLLRSSLLGSRCDSSVGLLPLTHSAVVPAQPLSSASSSALSLLLSSSWLSSRRALSPIPWARASRIPFAAAAAAAVVVAAAVAAAAVVVVVVVVVVVAVVLAGTCAWWRWGGLLLFEARLVVVVALALLPAC